MEFLNDVIISEEDTSTLGVLITHFDPAVYLNRSHVKLYTIQDLITAYPSMEPRGFQLDDSGDILSDTISRRIANIVAFQYMQKESNKVLDKIVDITDLVLLGVENSGFIIPNGKDLKDEEDFKDNSILVPFKNFKVSNSSFNIYASYDSGDGKYKTVSLLDMEYGSPTEFFMMMPADVDVEDYKSYLTELFRYSKEATDVVVYKVNIPLTGASRIVGEGFLNFLSYNVAFYGIGEKVIKDMNILSPKIPIVPAEPEARRPSRTPKVNVSIEHSYKKSRLKGIATYSKDKDQLAEYMKIYPDARVSLQWIQRIYSTHWFKEAYEEKGEDEATYISCINLLSECKKYKLKYALELRSYRYFIYKAGFANDTLGPILKGGGVYGESVKRTCFG